MAIIIPSAKTYDRNNPKVRDNVIERIEVGAVKILQNNKYKENVLTYNADLSNLNSGETPYDREFSWHSASYTTATAASYVQLTPYYFVGEIIVPKQQKNSIINKVYDKLDKNGTPYINWTVTHRKIIGQASVTLKVSLTQISGAYYSTEYEHSNLQKNYENAIVEEEVFTTPISNFLTVENEVVSTTGFATTVATATKSAPDETDLTEVFFEDKGEYYILKCKVLCACEQLKLSYKSTSDTVLIPSTNEYYLTGEAIYYKPEKLEITILGDTIGVDLQDNTFYINGETSKKVHSIEGNELMQTTNYILDGNGTKTNALDKMYGDTKKQYAKGKETATIRCSIGDYYENDTKVISIDKQRNLSTDIATARAKLSGGSYNVLVTLQQAFKKNIKAKISWLNDVGYKVERILTILAGETVTQAYVGSYRPTDIKIERISLETPMCFSIGDQVIPMVYGANGQDRPMSLYSDMTPKIFQVLAVRPYYDGAVWQELTLQEVAQSK